MDQPHTPDDMIELSRSPKKEFCLRFKKISGHTFRDFLNKERIEKALEVLKQTEYEITLHQLSALCGYENYITFYRIFLKFTGLPPAEHRVIGKRYSCLTARVFCTYGAKAPPYDAVLSR